MAAVQALYTDNQLFGRMCSGDKGALELLFKMHYASLCRFAKSILKDNEQAEDMVQEVFMKCWDKREQIQLTGSFKSYLYTAVRNHCFNALKINERKFWMEEGMEDDERIAVNDVIDHIAAKTLQDKITRAIELLPDKCRLTFQLSRFEDMSYKEIAETMGVSVKTVENQMGKALSVLRTSLAPYMKDLAVVFSLFFAF
ncbi:MAG: RNA polymerase sigma-70 factor [Bacteroidota bacterium]